MKTESCERYLADPEANAAHLAECEECAALFGPQSLLIETKPVSLDALPLAPWEGASHRAWLLVVGGALALFTIATALFAATGAAPIRSFAAALRAGVPPADIVRTLLEHVGMAAQNAPAAWQATAATLFVIVNAALILLLRRAPKGADLDA